MHASSDRAAGGAVAARSPLLRSSSLLYLGFEEIANLTEEVRDPARDFPRTVSFSIGITTLLCRHTGCADMACSGKLRGLAVTTPPSAFPALPARPAVAEALPGFEVAGWYDIAAPAKLPTSIFARLRAEIVRILNQPDIPERIRRGRLGTWGNSSEEFRHHMLADLDKWAKLVGERCEAGLKRRRVGRKKRRPEPPF